MLQTISYKKTKIVATLGPASANTGIIEDMAKAGVNVFRLNFSHGHHNFHKQNIDWVRAAEKKLGHPLAILADLQGPKFRVGTFEAGEAFLKNGQAFFLDLNKDQPGNENRVAFPHKDVFAHVQTGSRLLINDGQIELLVTETTPTTIKTVVRIGGKISDHKGVNLPEDVIPGSALTDKDRTDLKFILTQDIDFIALSFVQQKEDIQTLKKLVQNKAQIIAKIEKPQAIHNLDEIITEADAIMVARGDLGVECPAEKVPVLQKTIIKKCRDHGKPVIVATQMLESMIEAPTPTRAETSDVANAVYDGADAVMLSAESAAGKFPIEAVKTMARIISQAEQDPSWPLFATYISPPLEATVSDSITLATQIIVGHLQAAAIITYTTSGLTARRESQKRPNCPILGLTESETVARQLALCSGVLPYVLADHVQTFEDLTHKAKHTAKEMGIAKSNDKIVATFGVPFGRSGTTNIISVLDIE